MKLRSLVAIVSFSLVSLAGFAQSGKARGKAKKTTNKETADSTSRSPAWAKAHDYDATSHVYFPDYYTYYDPNRGGYVYWNNGGYVFTPAMPPFMEHVDLSRSRVQILKDLSLDLHPEQNYPHYMKLYPAVDANDGKVPVPIPGNPGQ